MFNQGQICGLLELSHIACKFKLHINILHISTIVRGYWAMFLHTQHSMQCTTTIYSRETIKRSRKSVPPYSKYVRNPTKTNSIKKTVDCCELYDLFKSNIIFFYLMTDWVVFHHFTMRTKTRLSLTYKRSFGNSTKMLSPMSHLQPKSSSSPSSSVHQSKSKFPKYTI